MLDPNLKIHIHQNASYEKHQCTSNNTNDCWITVSIQVDWNLKHINGSNQYEEKQPHSYL